MSARRTAQVAGPPKMYDGLGMIPLVVADGKRRARGQATSPRSQGGRSDEHEALQIAGLLLEDNIYTSLLLCVVR